jgi:outer membrane protein TolC
LITRLPAVPGEVRSYCFQLFIEYEESTVSLRSAIAFAAVVIGLSGCASDPPLVRPEQDAGELLGEIVPAEAITFYASGQGDDVGESPGELSLSQSLELTARNSPDIQIALARVRAAQAEAHQARLFSNPVLNLALRFPESGSTIIDAGISAELLSVLRRPGAINASDSKLRAASAEAVGSVLDALKLAQERYFTIQSLEAASSVLRERRALLDRLLSLAESRLRIGEGSRLDVITLQTQRVELEAEIADKELELRDERLALARLIGQPSSKATWKIPAWSLPAPLSIDERKCIQLSLERRPEIQQRRWELEALGFERKLASWAVLEGTTAGVDAERDGDWSVGPAFAMPLPLLDMGQAQRERATALLIEARHQLTASRRQVIEETRRTYSTLTATTANLARVRDELIPLQEDRLKQAEAQFRAGQADVTALLIAEQDLISSRSQMIELQQKVALARVRLERAVGGAAAFPTTQPSK